MMELTVSSTVFREGETIPAKYTCQGEDISPSITWGEPPDGTRSLAIIVDDPDAPGGVFTHWIIFNLPADTRQLPAAVPTQPRLDSGARQGKTDFGRVGYGGPCPPPGKPHRYQFTVYALDRTLDLAAGASRSQVLEAMQGNILSRGRLTGIYER
ncbi:MAG: YbhB/YbcL family Raf kinase inhibitor-like protein [Chloroflexi bacterium]|nr:YbhB/YbcL family Raf kinase inhibitor-like protein [Chloroflexota bacterium]